MATSRLLTDYVSADAGTAASLSGFDHLLASIRDILSTPIGSRRMRPTYGCRSAERLGAPLNASTTADLIADVAEAIFLWEPRVTLKRVVVTAALAAGALAMDLVCEINGRTVRLEGVV